MVIRVETVQAAPNGNGKGKEIVQDENWKVVPGNSKHRVADRTTTSPNVIVGQFEFDCHNGSAPLGIRDDPVDGTYAVP